MQAVCERLSSEWEKLGYSLARLSLETGIPDTTLRRAKTTGNISLENAVAIARVVHVSLDELTGLMSPPAAAAVKELEENVAEKYKPHTEHCATSCPARKAFKEDLNMIRSMYEAAAKKDDALYERGLAVKNDLLAKKDVEIVELKKEHGVRLARFRWGVFILLGIVLVLVGFIWYLFFIDFKNLTWGFFTTDLLIQTLEEAGYQIIAP